jgi:O-antigen/teichoic acid export membrane protein
MILNFNIRARIREVALLKSSRDVFQLFGGHVASQLVGILGVPVLLAIYSPNTFGIYALWLAAVSVISTNVSLRHEVLIIPLEGKQASDGVARLALAMTIIVSLSLLGILLFISDRLMQYYPLLDLVTLTSIPLAGAIYAIRRIFIEIHLRDTNYKIVATTRTLEVFFTIIVQSFFGILNPNLNGLIYGFLLASLISCLVLYTNGVKTTLSTFKFFTLKKSMLENKYIIQKIAPSHLFGSITSNSPIYILAMCGGNEFAGYYALATRIFSISAYISTSISEVYVLKASRAYSVGIDSLKVLYLQVVRISIGIAFVITFLGLVVSPIFIETFFYSNWINAIATIQILAAASFFTISFSSTDKNAIILGKINYIMYWHVFKGIATVLIAIASYAFDWSYYSALIALLALNSGLYILDFLLGVKWIVFDKCRFKPGTE